MSCVELLHSACVNTCTGAGALAGRAGQSDASRAVDATRTVPRRDLYACRPNTATRVIVRARTRARAPRGEREHRSGDATDGTRVAEPVTGNGRRERVRSGTRMDALRRNIDLL